LISSEEFYVSPTTKFKSIFSENQFGVSEKVIIYICRQG